MAEKDTSSNNHSNDSNSWNNNENIARSNCKSINVQEEASSEDVKDARALTNLPSNNVPDLLEDFSRLNEAVPEISPRGGDENNDISQTPESLLCKEGEELSVEKDYTRWVLNKIVNTSRENITNIIMILAR